MNEELIKFKDYNPSRLTNEQLADDWRLVCAFYSSLKSGKKLKYSNDEVLAVAQLIYNEIVHRVKDGKMKHEFKPDEMQPYSKELYDHVKLLLSADDFSQPDYHTIAVADDFTLDDNALPIYPGHESDIGEMIKLDDLLPRLRSAVASLRSPFIYLVGSLANWGETQGDIDILVRARADDDIFKLVKWRILRAFPDLKERIHIFHDDRDGEDTLKGPITSHYALADLDVNFHDTFERVVMSVSRIIPFKYFKMLKPMHGRKKGEIYSIESVLATVPDDWYDEGIYVEQKFDGCVPYNTLIITNDGNLQIGDIVNNHLDVKVLSFNFNTSTLEFKPITTYWKNSSQSDWIKLAAGKHVLTLTPNHVVFTPTGEVPAQQLAKGDSILLPVNDMDICQEQVLIGTLPGAASRLVSLKIDNISKVKTHSLIRYNLEVENNHNYFAGGILVGNCHVQAHKEGSKVKIITEDGSDVTRNCPIITKELANVKHDFVVCGEMELWQDGKHQPRARTAGVLNSKIAPPEAQNLKLNLFDCVYFEGASP